jgi:transcription initiation factor TFIIIB Brf1 subunit/transcription initiation factor TFIIB
MPDLPSEAEKLLAVAPDRFVAERKALATKLREEGNAEGSAAVEGLRKPTAVVFAVNRGARDRPNAAKAAADAAARVKSSQLGGDPDEFQQALRDLEDALDLLADVALAHVAPRGKDATDAMRRRVRDLLRAAVADDDAREALARGALTEELDAPGFSPFAGMPASAGAGQKRSAKKRPTQAERRKAEKQERVAALREELRQAEEELDAAAKTAREAERVRARALAKVETLKKKLARAE